MCLSHPSLRKIWDFLHSAVDYRQSSHGELQGSCGSICYFRRPWQNPAAERIGYQNIRNCLFLHVHWQFNPLNPLFSPYSLRKWKDRGMENSTGHRQFALWEPCNEWSNTQILDSQALPQCEIQHLVGCQITTDSRSIHCCWYMLLLSQRMQTWLFLNILTIFTPWRSQLQLQDGRNGAMSHHWGCRWRFTVRMDWSHGASASFLTPQVISNVIHPSILEVHLLVSHGSMNFLSRLNLV